MFSLADDGLASILCNTSIYSYFVGNPKQTIEGCKWRFAKGIAVKGNPYL